MKVSNRIFLFVFGLIAVAAQKFEEESPYMEVRWLDMTVPEWKPGMLEQLEKTLDSELKYIDERKGVECRSIKFEQEAGYPKSDNRFLVTSIRGLCTDERGKVHNIPKEILIVATERKIDDVHALVGARLFSAGNVQIYKRNRNLLNLIIIPISIGIITLIFVFTFVLRHIRYGQKRRHILSELEKKKDLSVKKGPAVANPNPNATEKERLLQLDPNVVGNASNTLGSPKEFTKDSYPNPTRQISPSGAAPNREYQNLPSTITSRDNRGAQNSRPDEGSQLNQRSGKSNSRERSQVPYNNETRLNYEPQHPDMIPMQDQQPRVVVRTIRDDGNPSPGYSQSYSDPSTRFVPIPVQVERSVPRQQYVPPPYHSDPYYRQSNA